MVRKRQLKPYLAESFTNNKGQVISPGDEILIVTSSRQNVSVSIGRYLGKRKSRRQYGDQERFDAVVEVDCVHNKTVLKTDESVEWHYNYEKMPGLELPPELPYSKYPDFGYNYGNRTPEQQKLYDDYQAAYKARQERDRERWNLIREYEKKFYKQIQIPYVRTTTLQRNRIYGINSGLSILKGGLN